MLKVLTRTAAIAAIASLPVGASALDFTVTQFSKGNLGDSRVDYGTIVTANFATVFAVEDFEDSDKFTVGQIGADSTASLSTAVGTFTTLNGKPINPADDADGFYGSTAGSGTTAIDEFNARGSNKGQNLAIRQNDDEHNNGGRQNTSFTTADGDGNIIDNTYLDSNDTRGFRWVAKTDDNDLFDRLLFTLTDPADQGKTLTISAGGFTETYTITPTKPNGEIFNVLIGFSTGVNNATISLAKSGTNDGFSIDNVTVGAVPLPAAAWLLLGVSGALVGAKRRSARKAA
jgi:hypothetical protein